MPCFAEYSLISAEHLKGHSVPPVGNITVLDHKGLVNSPVSRHFRIQGILLFLWYLGYQGFLLVFLFLDMFQTTCFWPASKHLPLFIQQCLCVGVGASLTQTSHFAVYNVFLKHFAFY